jgi:hypothetical protein
MVDAFTDLYVSELTARAPHHVERALLAS